MDNMRENQTNSDENVLELDSDVTELLRLRSFIDTFCQLEGVPEEACYKLQVAIEELVLNTIKYGQCDPKNSAIRVVLKREGGEIHTLLTDRGIRFNPLEAPTPDLTANLRDRPVGGLGIHIVRHLIPSIRYERREGRNYLYLVGPVISDSGTV
jgi:serine/threonine-protein kinase RsbW